MQAGSPDVLRREGKRRQATPPTHLGFLDGMRALAALFVVMHHAMLQVAYPWERLPPSFGPLVSLFLFGHDAVDVFIVLSGFCLMLPVVRSGGHLKGGALRFFAKRARRILPPYYLAMGFSLLLSAVLIGHKTGTHWDCALPVTRAGLVTHLLLVQDLFQKTYCQINHVFWSISVEWRIYFVFPLLVIAWRRLGAWPTAATTVAVSYLLLTLLKRTPIFTETCGVSPQYLGLFALGMLGADIAFTPTDGWRTWARTFALPVALLAATVLVLLFSSFPIWHGRLLPVPLMDFFVGLAAMLLLIQASFHTHGILNRLLSWRPLVFLGTFAYSIYLIHAPLLQVLWQTLFVPLHARPLLLLAAYWLLGTPLIVGCSYHFFLLCERPFLNTRRNETLPETARDAALAPAP